MQATAIHKYAHISAQKGASIADQIRGKHVEKATELLKFSDKKAATFVKKVLDSAIANAEHNEGADIDELRVSEVQVNEGPTQRRFKARARGRGTKILKRTCHITVTVSDV